MTDIVVTCSISHFQIFSMSFKLGGSVEVSTAHNLAYEIYTSIVTKEKCRYMNDNLFIFNLKKKANL